MGSSVDDVTDEEDGVSDDNVEDEGVDEEGNEAGLVNHLSSRQVILSPANFVLGISTWFSDLLSLKIIRIGLC